ncbi:helix-hairpin-helix domain-containing protein [Sulfurovum sp. bin170]|uniref:ComEA family DNA-binding protein n=1 Tax=Sulfurovum sp. bin170 TaxID=2695268 RepID=UPI0013E063CA|nr:helix-hairpin-helix domain-containing protein [Sulfurovum sp. bin170]NEW59936.1 helix-hairpin-helix domain-containing protein [Sulfurovum sp. bin170]
MKKILLFMALSVSFLFSAINLQTASKDELICIKGIGDKKAEAIIKYRKSNKLKSADDLINIKGFGKGLIAKVKSGEKTVKCGGKKSKKAPAKKKDSKKETSIKKSDSKKSDEKKESKTSESKKTEKKSEDQKSSDKE